MDKKNYFDLGEDDTSYGIIETTINKKEFMKIVNKVRTKIEDYCVDDVLDLVKKRDNKAKFINKIGIYF